MNDILPVLALETSDSICGACVYLNNNNYFSSKVVLKHSHSEKLFELISAVISNSSLLQKDIKSIALSIGPGSFTGLRIGMSAAKGLAEALKIPILTVPTFEALALQIANYLPDSSYFSIINKAGREDAYFAKFQINGNNYIFKEQLKIVPLLAVSEYAGNSKIFGNYNLYLKNSDIFENAVSAPEPEFVARWAVKYGKKINVEQIDFLEPLYIKNFIFKEK